MAQSADSKNTFTPTGCVEARKGSQIAPKGVADLLLEGRDRRPCVAAKPPARLSFLRLTAKNAPILMIISYRPLFPLLLFRTGFLILYS
jgi:hypothetical protein